MADPGFLTKLLPCMGSPGVRLVHTPPGYSNVASGADVFNQVRPQLWLPPVPQHVLICTRYAVLTSDMVPDGKATHRHRALRRSLLVCNAREACAQVWIQAVTALVR